jgi:carbamoyl-phosphate synthase small subunit
VDGKSLGRRARVTHQNLNDGTVEGIEVLDAPAFGVQYHPEASPGPHDARALFARFVGMMERR